MAETEFDQYKVRKVHTRVAVKEHKCRYCNVPIQPGQIYYDGWKKHLKMHPECWPKDGGAW